MNFTRQHPNGKLTLSPLVFDIGDSLLELDDGLLSFSLDAANAQSGQSFKDALCKSILNKENKFNQDKKDKCISSHIFKLTGNKIGGLHTEIVQRLVSIGFDKQMAEDLYWFQNHHGAKVSSKRFDVTRQQAVDYIKSLDIPDIKGWEG